MALLNFPENPIPNQLYPDPCPIGVTQYRWDSGAGIWRIVGVATGVTPGTYGNDVTVSQVTIDVQGVVTNASNIAIRSAGIGVSGIVPLNDTLTSSSVTEALTAKAGKSLQDQIGNLGVCIVPEKDNVVTALNFLQKELERVDVENLTWCGYYNALDGYVSYVSAAGVILGYRLGQELPVASKLNAGNFFIVNVSGNPYLGGDFRAPNEECALGNWILQDLTKWVRVNTGTEVTARDVKFDNRGSCFTANNVQTALQQVCSAFRTPVGGATIATSKPTNPYQGQLWWDNEDGYFYIYYRDGNGAQWIEVGGGGSESLGGGGGGSVYEVRTGVGLSGGPITTEGTISLDPAQTDTIGGVAVPQNRGLKLLKTGELSLAPATRDIIGGIKVGANLTVSPDGTLNATGGGEGGGTADNVTVRPIPGLSAATSVQQALEDIQVEVQNRVESAVVLDDGLTVSVTPPNPDSNQGTQLRLTPVRANTTRVGVVSLTNDVNGISESTSLTQRAGNLLQNEIKALTGVLVLAGTYDASAGQMYNVTPAGQNKGFVVGRPVPVPTPAIDNYYVIVVIGGNRWPSGSTGPATAGNWYVCQDKPGINPSWVQIDFTYDVIAASNVYLAEIPGLSATNVQDGIAELQANRGEYTKKIIPGEGLNVIYAPNRDCLLDVKPATSGSLGSIYVSPARGLNLGSDGGLSLAPPTTDGITIGGVKAGKNITIAADGTISATGGGGGGGSAIDIQVSPIPGIQQATNVQRALELIEIQAQDRVEFAETFTPGVTVKVTDPPSGTYDGTTLTIDIDQATTGGRGLVQLTNDITGQSETIAPTQKAINVLNSKIDALIGSNVLAGTYSSATGTMVSITPAGAASGFIVGSQAPLAKNVPDNYYIIVVTGGGFGPVGARIPDIGVQPGDWFVVERETGLDPAWITIDFDQAVVAAQNVSVAPIPGLAALNAQSAFTEIVEDLSQAVTQIGSSNNGISVTNTSVQPLGLGGYGIRSELTLNPATSQDLGGVFVAPGFGLNLAPTGGLSASVATSNSLGSVKIGSGLDIDESGTVSVSIPDIGTVTAITFLAPLTGGTITRTGTVGIANATPTQPGAMTAAYAQRVEAVPANVGTNASGNRTVSTSPPSGGNDGDIWYVV